MSDIKYERYLDRLQNPIDHHIFISCQDVENKSPIEILDTIRNALNNFIDKYEINIHDKEYIAFQEGYEKGRASAKLQAIEAIELMGS